MAESSKINIIMKKMKFDHLLMFWIAYNTNRDFILCSLDLLLDSTKRLIENIVF